MLGPLVVAMAAVRIREWDAQETHAPDLWSMLESAVCRSPRDGKSRVPVADSKKLKLPNASVKRHPLTHLERGVLSFLQAAGHEAATDDELFKLVGVSRDGDAVPGLPGPWYAGAPVKLPLASTLEALRIDANRIAVAMERTGVELISLRVRLFAEGAFNAILREHGSKAAVTGSAVTSLIAEARRRWGAESSLRLVIDRQSGRSDYRPVLNGAVPGGRVEPISVSPERSSYILHADDARDMRAHFMTKAEEQHLPVALASMTAKLVRELAMHRFNRYWSGRIPELKPTAGYVTDARRWLRDASGHITDEERAAMVRLA